MIDELLKESMKSNGHWILLLTFLGVLVLVWDRFVNDVKEAARKFGEDGDKDEGMNAIGSNAVLRMGGIRDDRDMPDPRGLEGLGAYEPPVFWNIGDVHDKTQEKYRVSVNRDRDQWATLDNAYNKAYQKALNNPPKDLSGMDIFAYATAEGRKARDRKAAQIGFDSASYDEGMRAHTALPGTYAEGMSGKFSGDKLSPY